MQYRFAALPAALFLCLVVLGCDAKAHDPKNYPDMPKEVLEWLGKQKSPKTGGLCCNQRDGVYAEEEIRDGVYWVRFDRANGEWMPVPGDVVIKDPNRAGHPVVWWYLEHGDHGKLMIKCFAPGGKV